MWIKINFRSRGLSDSWEDTIGSIRSLEDPELSQKETPKFLCHQFSAYEIKWIKSKKSRKFFKFHKLQHPHSVPKDWLTVWRTPSFEECEL